MKTVLAHRKLLTLVRKRSMQPQKLDAPEVFFILFLGVKKVLGASIFILIGMKTLLFVVIDMKTVLAHRKHLSMVRKRSITIQNDYWLTKKSRCGTI
jgi:heme exporter protein D